jgi:large subunit ribosomal protein L21
MAAACFGGYPAERSSPMFRPMVFLDDPRLSGMFFLQIILIFQPPARVPVPHFLTGEGHGFINPPTARAWPARFVEGLGPSPENRKKTMFAVIKTGGKQYTVAADQKIELGRLAGKEGEIVTFPVIVLGGDKPSVGAPLVSGALVAAEIVEHTRGDKVIAFKKRRRQNSRRKRGHRQDHTVVRITEILTDGKQPSKVAKPRQAKPKAAKPKAEAKETVEKEKKTAAKK